MAKPKILWIDDQYGNTQNGGNRLRDIWCDHLGLKDITGDYPPRTDEEDEAIAEVVFCRGQVEVDGNVRNDLDGTLEVVRNGWKQPPRWALLLLDMEFRTGPIDEHGDPMGRDEDSEPERYFGLTILDALWSDPDLRDIPIVIVSAMEREAIERRFAAQGVWAFVEKDLDFFDRDRLKKTLRDYALLEDDRIIGRSLPLLKCLREARQRANIPNDNILILGESGAGKELLAEYIHRQSGKTGQYVPFFPQGVPETLIEDRLFGHRRGAFTDAKSDQPGAAELADNGTLFIDEFGDIPATVQAKFLRLLDKNIRETQRVGEPQARKLKNLQIIMATEREEVLYGRDFRKALLARAQVHNLIRIPPLRQRLEDIPVLVEHFVKHYEAEFNAETRQVSEEALDALKKHPWPGNVRELASVIESAVSTFRDVRWLEFNHLKFGTYETQSQPISSHPPATETVSDLDEILEKPPPTAETPAHVDFDDLIRNLDGFSFEGYQHSDLSGKLPQIEGAYAKFVASYLKAALNLRDGVQYQAAMRCITGDDDLSGTQAKRQVEKILGLTKTPYLISNDSEILEGLREFVESDPVLKKACDKILGRDADRQKQ